MNGVGDWLTNEYSPFDPSETAQQGPYSTNNFSGETVNQRHCSEQAVSGIVRSDFFLEPTLGL
jgi:hypothetical protein